jgi:ribosome-associated protein
MGFSKLESVIGKLLRSRGAMNDIKTDQQSAPVSKSQRRREALAWLDLARKLMTLPERQCARLPLDEDLRSAVAFARSISGRGARKRQLKTIAGMLRRLDAREVVRAVDQLDERQRQANARHHLAEAWRDRLLDGRDRALATLLAHCPQLNSQRLRQLVRNAGREARAGKPPAAARKLFRLLRETDAQTPLPPLPPDSPCTDADGPAE